MIRSFDLRNTDNSPRSRVRRIAGKPRESRRRFLILETLEHRIVLTRISQVASFQGPVESNTNSGSQPSDSSIAVGPSSIISLVNRQVTLSSRLGTGAQTASLGPGGSSTDFFNRVDHGLWVDDSTVEYDTYSNIFIILMNETSNNSGSYYNIAVSKTSAPQDLDLNEANPNDWYFYSFSSTHNFGNGNDSPDFPNSL